MSYDAALPCHVGIIMDGNGRWAKKRGMPRPMGHRAGVRTLIKLSKYLFSLGVRYVSVYAFSTENKLRPKDEVDELIALIRKHFKTSFKEFSALGIHIRWMGDETYFPDDVVQLMKGLGAENHETNTGVLNFALNYGGRDELVRAANAVLRSGTAADTHSFGQYLYTADMPDPDLILRTGGEKRLSNFMLYQAAYAELFFTDTLWPDFSTKDMDAVLAEYAGRNRRFGRV